MVRRRVILPAEWKEAGLPARRRGLPARESEAYSTFAPEALTTFAHKAAAVETVTLSFEDGTWAVTAYSVK